MATEPAPEQSIDNTTRIVVAAARLHDAIWYANDLKSLPPAVRRAWSGLQSALGTTGLGTAADADA